MTYEKDIYDSENTWWICIYFCLVFRAEKNYTKSTEELYKKDHHDSDNHDADHGCDHSFRAKHPGMWGQVGLRNYHYEQS